MQERSGIAVNHMIKKIFLLLCGLFLLMLSLYLYQTFKPHYNSYNDNYNDYRPRYESTTKYHENTVPEQDELSANKTDAEDRWKDEVYFANDLLSSSDVNLRRYRVHLTARTWYEAVTSCWEDGGHLATPGDQEESHLLSGMLKAARESGNITNTQMKEAMHIGLNYIVSKTWTTLLGNKVDIHRFKWIKSMSQYGQRDYFISCAVVLSNGRMSDHQCDERLIYACDMQQQDHSTNNEETTYTEITSDGYEAVTAESRFRIYKSPLSWLDAFDVCEKDGGHLMTPNVKYDMTVWNWIASRLPKSLSDGGVLFGINNLAKKMVWSSFETSYFSWSSWAMKPIGRERNCAILLPQAKIDYVSCDEPKPFVCEKNIPENVREKIEYKEVEGLGVYALHTVPKNWGQAVLQCHFENATLAVPDSPEEAEMLAEMYRKCPTCRTTWVRDDHLWVGISDLDGDHIWRKLNGERTYGSTFNEWHSQASIRDVGALCGALRNGSFFNGYCSSKNCFICEK